MRRQRAQVLVFFALALPLILLPIAAYAVDASVTAGAYARLVEVSTRAAEEAVQQIDVARLRAGAGISIDAAGATAAVQVALGSAEPQARLAQLTILGEELRLVTTETVVLPFNLFGSPDVGLRATVTTRIAPGYDSPSSRFPFPVSTF
jgi:hypothetical protein